jgi:hypothetical protein
MVFDAAKLEAKLSSTLVASTSEQERIVAVSNTFSEVIEQDGPFGSLLMRIKAAYTDFLKQRAGQAPETVE